MFGIEIKPETSMFTNFKLLTKHLYFMHSSYLKMFNDNEFKFNSTAKRKTNLLHSSI